ncbi:Integrase catalytic core, partial [Trinorchestia longiramus]
NNRIVVEMGSFPDIKKPLDRVGIDLIEMTPSHEGHRYIITIVDHFSRYVAAYPLESKTTEEVTRALTKYVTTYGPVKELISDRGTEFTSALFRDVCQKLRIK